MRTARESGTTAGATADAAGATTADAAGVLNSLRARVWAHNARGHMGAYI